MKRFVYVPEHLHNGGDAPIEALELADKSCLSIRLGESGDGISSEIITFISVPEHRYIDVPQYARVGYVHMVDITDEFTSFCADAYMAYSLNGESFTVKPRLREVHKMLFRPRFLTAGTVSFAVINCGSEYITGEIYVQ